MFLVPLLAGVVGLSFAVVVAFQFTRRRKPYQAVWAAALGMFALAALFETLGTEAGWSDATYKGYYLFGGLLNVGWLGVGSVLLLSPGRVGQIAVIAMGVVSVVSVAAVAVSHTDASLLLAAVPAAGAISVPVGLPALTNIAGSLLLIGGAGWSAWKAYRGHAPANRVIGTALIAAGAFIVAGGHSYARTKGVYVLQPLSEALGIILMFGGYLEVEQRLFAKQAAPKQPTQPVVH
jgi:hypothetical protein